jgi:hypothetical protein
MGGISHKVVSSDGLLTVAGSDHERTWMHLLRKLTSAHAIALIALFVALGGTAGAAAVDLITGEDIRDGSVRGRDIRDRSLRGKDLGRGSIKARQLRTGSVRSVEVRNGTLRARDFNRRDLPGLTRKTVRAPNITNYSNFDPIVSTERVAPVISSPWRRSRSRIPVRRMSP